MNLLYFTFVKIQCFQAIEAAKGKRKKKTQFDKIATAFQSDDEQQHIEDAHTIVQVLEKTLNPPLRRRPTAVAKAPISAPPVAPVTQTSPAPATTPPASTNQSQLIKCIHSSAIPLPTYVDNPTLNRQIELLLSVQRVDDAKYLALNEFEEFKQQLWDFIAKKKIEALRKSAQMLAPTYIVNIGVFHAFKLAEENMRRFHTSLFNAFSLEFNQLSKTVQKKKQQFLAISGKFKQRLQDYESRAAELDCLFQKGLAFLVPAKKPQAGNKSNRGAQGNRANRQRRRT